MPADLILFESQLQEFIERTVLSVMNARARLAATEVPVQTGDVEIQFSGVLLMDTGASALKRETQTITGGAVTKTTVIDPAQKTTTRQEADESSEESNSENAEEATSGKNETATENATKKGTTDQSETDKQTSNDTSDQSFGRGNTTENEYLA